MIELIDYINSKNETVTIYYNEEKECTVIINYDAKELRIIDEIKNMNADTLEFIVKDFKRINRIGYLFNIDYEDLNWLKEYEYSQSFFNEIIENTDNEELKEMLIKIN